MYTKRRFVRILILFLLISINVKADALPEEINDSLLLSKAFTSFENEDYAKALPIFKQLEELYPEDAEYKYYLGVCQLKMNTELINAVSNLEVALNKKVNNVVAFSLAEAYHKTLQLDMAIRYYNEFKSKYKNDTFGVERKIQMCKNGLLFINTYRNLNLSESSEIGEKDFYKSYSLPGFSKLLVNFEDSTSKELMCSTYKDDFIYYSKTAENTKNGSDLYRKKDKKEEILTVLNTKYDEAYPFMSPDGKTIFFSSTGFDSMGGFDIFKSTYDKTTDSWSKPQNLGFPINSSHDDLFFVLDSTGTKASFSSTRESPKGKLMVYTVDYSPKADRRIVRGYEKLTYLANLSNLNKLRENEFVLGKFEFKIKDSLIYTSINDFRSPKAKDLFIQAKKDQSASKQVFQEINKLREKLIFLAKDEEKIVSDQIVALDEISIKLNEKVMFQFDNSRLIELKLYPKPITENGDIENIIAQKGPVNTIKKYTSLQNNSVSGISYNVFLGEFTETDFIPLSTNLNSIMIQKKDKDINEYFIGPYSSYESAKNSYLTVKTKFEKSRIVAFNNGIALMTADIYSESDEMEFIANDKIIDKTKESIDDKMNRIILESEELTKQNTIDRPKIDLPPVNTNLLFESAIVAEQGVEEISTNELTSAQNITPSSLNLTPDLMKTNNQVSGGVIVELLADENTEAIETVSKEIIVEEVKLLEKENVDKRNENISESKYPVFKVQVAVFSGKVPAFVENKLNDFKDYKVEYLSVSNTGRTVCNVGNLASYKTAGNLKFKLEQAGFKGAFTVAYLGGKQIKVSEAIKLLTFN